MVLITVIWEMIPMSVLEPYDEPLNVDVMDGEVVMTSANRGAVAVSLTRAAARETAHRLNAATAETDLADDVATEAVEGR
jgi:hypothetical protein